jgi:MFS transporter, UMF1 family
MNNPAKSTPENAWVLFSFAASGFSVTLQAGILPTYFRQVLAGNLEPALATSYWGYTTAFSLLLVSLLAPFLGSLGDLTGRRRQILMISNFIAVLATALMVLAGTGQWILGSILYIVSATSLGYSFVFSDALLPHVAEGGDTVRASIRSYSWTYLGGLTTLILALILIMGVFPGSDWGVRLAFLGIAIWWGVFSFLALRKIPEPAPRPKTGGGEGNLFFASLKDAGMAFKELVTKRRNAFLLLTAMGLYGGGIGTIGRMATVFGLEIGIGTTELIGALAMNNLVSFIVLSVMGRYIGRFKEKNAITAGLVIYTLIAVGGYFMRSQWMFWMLAFWVGVVQGVVMGLTRGLFCKFVPLQQSGQMFGVYAVAQNLSALLGPFLFAQAGLLFGSVRLGMLPVLMLFLAGRIVLLFVDKFEPLAESEQPAASPEAA